MRIFIKILFFEKKRKTPTVFFKNSKNPLKTIKIGLSYLFGSGRFFFNFLLVGVFHGEVESDVENDEEEEGEEESNCIERLVQHVPVSELVRHLNSRQFFLEIMVFSANISDFRKLFEN